MSWSFARCLSALENVCAHLTVPHWQVSALLSELRGVCLGVSLNDATVVPWLVPLIPLDLMGYFIYI